jgi:hypothetical protein
MAEVDRECFNLVEHCPTFGCQGLDGFPGPRPTRRLALRPGARIRPLAKAAVPAAGLTLGVLALAAGGFELVVAAGSWALWLLSLPFQAAAYVLASEPWIFFEVLINILAAMF